MNYNSRKAGNWVLFAFTFPWALITWLIGLLSIAAYVAHKPRFEQAALLTLEWRPWVREKLGFRYSTTLGRLIWYNIGHRDTKPGEDGAGVEAELDERLERHETVHVRQVEDRMILAFLVGLAVAIGFWTHGHVGAGFAWWLGLWTSGGVWQVPNFLGAICRYGWIGVYRDSEHERSAYGQTDRWPDGSSWWDHRDKQREAQQKPF